MTNPIVPNQAEVRDIDTMNIAQTMSSLSTVIERSLRHLALVKRDLKLQREEMQSMLENDSAFREAKQEAQQVANMVKREKQRIAASEFGVSTKLKIAELNEQKKELEEVLSTHLNNYQKITNAKVFDTSLGEQVEFEVKAKVKSGQLKLFE